MAFAEKYAPRFVIRFIRRSLDDYRRNPPRLLKGNRAFHPQLSSFDDCYPDLEKQFYSGPKVIETPEAVTIPFKEDAAYLKGTTYTIPEDYVVPISDALYSGSNHVVFTQDMKIVDESSNAGKLKYIFQKDLYSRNEILISGSSILWRSRFHNYYHLLIDTLPRLLPFKDSTISGNEELNLVCPGGLSKTDRFFLDKLGLENIRMVEGEEQAVYRLETLLFTPHKTRRQAGYIPPKYVEQLRSVLHPSRESKQDKRIFISRENARRRKVENLDDVWSALAQRGFQKVVLEDLTPQEQIDVLFDAEAVVGTHGAGLTNMLFSTKLKVLEIFPTWYVVPHYYYLSKSLGFEYDYLCGSGDAINPISYEVDVAQMLKALDNLGVH